jgi:ribosomal protein S18 acetylase RimI-like enzyme
VTAATTSALIRFRPAVDSDRQFLFGVYASSREAELAPVPWTAEQRHAFLEQQFNAQDHHYRTHYVGAEFLVVLVDGRNAGRLYVHRSTDDILVLDIALLPEEQGRGVGTSILSGLVAEADLSGRSMSLHVEPDNPALRLYQRLGFRVEEEVGVYLRLGRPPGGAGAPAAR